MNASNDIKIHFSHYFDVDPTLLSAFGAFNISLINDLPLFIDPFLLFNSQNEEYRNLHDRMIEYLRFLRDKSIAGQITPGLIGAWFTFTEVKQTWLGFSQVGNEGRGLGHDFAFSLSRNLRTVFSSFGDERVTKGSHLEKLTLIEDGVGRDKISDFTTVLIKEYLLCYTQEFAKSNIRSEFVKSFAVPKVRFNYMTESWESASFDLPYYENDYVILTPRDMLTKDDTWINKTDLIYDYDHIVQVLPNEQLRDQLNNYLFQVLPKDATAKEKREAINLAIRRYPQYLEYYILHKEERGDVAVSISEEKIAWSEHLFVEQVRELVSRLQQYTNFYELIGDTFAEAKKRAEFLKDVIENKGGWRLLYVDGKPVTRESDLHILYRLTWFATASDVSREVNDGRGPADFKISRGSIDKTIVEFKLARNSQLKRNLEKQVDIYKKASDADKDLKVILYFTESEYERVIGILRDLGIEGDPSIILIDARSDNKPSASKA